MRLNKDNPKAAGYVQLVETIEVPSRAGLTYHKILQLETFEKPKRAIAAGKARVGIVGVKVNEHYNMMQCSKCQRYTHFGHSCKALKPSCRQCAGDHEKEFCPSLEKSPKCINCIRANEQDGTDININHRVTDTNCRVRMIRREHLRQFWSSTMDA